MIENKYIAQCEPDNVYLQRMNVTVGENIDNKISQLQAEIERLKSSKETLGPLLGMKIGDIREAMNY